MGEIFNKVKSSGLITIDVADWIKATPQSSLDISQWFWQGMAVKEKMFREALEEHTWETYRNHQVCIFSSTEAIVPHWAWMLVTIKLVGVAEGIHYCHPSELPEKVVLQAANSLQAETYANQRVIIKGCGEYALSPAVYVAIAHKLSPQVQSLMFGEPCSTVPLYKKKKQASE